MKKYKVVAILHSGENGRRRRPVRSKQDVDLLGKHIFCDIEEVKMGKPFKSYMEGGYSHFDFVDSGEFETEKPVVARRYLKNKGEEYYEIETENRIYKLVKA